MLEFMRIGQTELASESSMTSSNAANVRIRLLRVITISIAEHIFSLISMIVKVCSVWSILMNSGSWEVQDYVGTFLNNLARHVWLRYLYGYVDVEGVYLHCQTVFFI